MRTSNFEHWFKTHQVLVLVGVFIVCLIVIVLTAVAVRAPGSGGETVPPEGEVSLEGTLTCLPHKDTSGPQTLECAIGLKSGETYYALKDETPSDSQLMTMPFNEQVNVTGTLQHEENDLYQTAGTVTVDEISQKE